MLYPELIITVLLGGKWETYSPLLLPFGLFFFTFCLFSLISDAIIAQGKVRALFLFDVSSTLIIIETLLLAGTGGLDAKHLREQAVGEIQQVQGLISSARDIDNQLRNVNGLVFPGADEPQTGSPPLPPTDVRVA